MYIKRRRKTARRIIPICVIVVAALLIAMVVGGSLAIGTRTQRDRTPLALAKEASVMAVGTLPPEMDEPTDASSQVKGKWYGLCSKSSARSVEDLRRTVESDPVLATHYADFDWSRASAEKLQQPAAVHLAYRKDDLIRYTTRRINLPIGEHYITDGNRNIRPFCCNDFVDALPRTQAGPVLHSLPAPPPPLDDRRDTGLPSNGLASPIAGMPQPRSGDSPHPSSFYSSPGGRRPPRPVNRIQDPPEPVAVPEPGTILLFGSGVVGMCMAGMIRRRRKRERNKDQAPPPAGRSHA